MTGVWILLRGELAARKKSLVALALITGAFGTVVLSTAAAARRTESSYDRFLDTSHAAQIEVGNNLDPDVIETISRFPEVARAARYTFFLMTPEPTPGKPDSIEGVSFGVPPDGEWLNAVDRLRLIRGRLPDPSRADEAVVNEAFAQRFHLVPGDPMPFRAYTPEQLYTVIFEGRQEPPSGPLVRVTVVGVVRLYIDLTELSTNPLTTRSIGAFGTPALYRAHASDVANYGLNLGVRLRSADPRAAASFVRRVERLAASMTEAGRENELFADTRQEAIAPARDAVRVQAIALGLFAALTGVATILVLGQSLSRWIHRAAVDHPTLRALGMSRANRFAVGFAPAAIAVGAGTVLAVMGAAFASTLFPLGFARLAEPHLGIDLDATVLVGGGAAFAIALLARASVAALRAAAVVDRIEPEVRSSPVAAMLSRAPLPPGVSVGARMALTAPRARGRISARAASIGAILALAAMSASLAIASSTHLLVTEPHLQGINWDVALNSGDNPDNLPTLVRELSDNPAIGSFSTALLSDLFIGGRRTQAFLVSHERGNVFFSLIDGTEPRGPKEIALGTETLRRLGAGIGDRVIVKGGAQTRMTIVGRIVLPGIDDDTLADGAAMDAGAADALKPEVDFPIVFARLTRGTDRDAAIDTLTARYAHTNVQANARPPAVINLQRVQDLPPQLAQLLLALAVATVAHTVIGSVRESRRDIAVLKTIGFVRRQAVTVVSAQATTFILVALIVGIPMGYAAGRWLWIALADRVGFVPAPTIDVAALTIYAVGVFVAANLAAAWPGRLAARSRPAVELRTE